MSLVDLHLHLLPGVDDGAPDLEGALSHAGRLERDGVHDVVVTPHIGHPWFDVDVRSLAGRTAALQREIDAAGVRLRVRAGGELHPSGIPGLSSCELEAVAQGPPGSRWLLLEAPFDGIEERFLQIAASLQSGGYGLLIAHPERASGLLRAGLSLLRPLLRGPVALQVNVCSLLGRHGLEVREAAEHLIRTRLAYVLASDGHPGTREHTLKAGLDLAVRAGASQVQAWQLTRGNPRFLLDHGLPKLPADEHRPAWRAPYADRVEAVRQIAARA